MEHNTNQNSNYLALLNLADDGTYTVGSLTLTHGPNSQKSFRYGFFYVKFLFLYVVCVVFL